MTLQENKMALVEARKLGDEDLQRVLSQKRQDIKIMLSVRCSVCGRKLSRKYFGYVTRFCNLHMPQRLSMKMKKWIAAALVMSSLPFLQAGSLFWYWTNGDNPTATTNILMYGVSSGIYTGSVYVPFGQTNVLTTNLVAGQRYYGVVFCTDGVDVSPQSNEANAKTKMNPPKSLTAVAQ